MTDPSSFATALWTLLISAAFVLALGLAIISDMALRRREDRAAATRRRAESAESAARNGHPAAR
ncbi:hypothetical protein BJF83_10905 [Nocardiopsis sp. CNR-923]|uniref:hypothetical protein n=1 Tax=Nocardiopsis sp. CNR-923 TaxID=1904965 RepID=UPI000964482F|nr:hypothetical protein [Nocardiopsis sp. CNR-923]OLT29638.1 hypothetical protein BJF83_10905 [Nocardiopsis sp. CNR-923]